MGVIEVTLDRRADGWYAMVMETPLNNSTDISFSYGGLDIEIEDVDFHGTFCSEPPEPSNGYPGFMEAEIKLDEPVEVVEQVEQWFDECNEYEVEIDPDAICEAAIKAIEEKVCGSPGDFID